MGSMSRISGLMGSPPVVVEVKLAPLAHAPANRPSHGPAQEISISMAPKPGNAAAM